MKAELVPKFEDDPPIPLTLDVMTLGRHSQCDIVLDHPSLSKQHVILIKTDGLVWVRDLASTNGIRVNGQRAHWGALLPGDSLALGQVRFTVYLGPDHIKSPSELLEEKDVPMPSVSDDAIPAMMADIDQETQMVSALPEEEDFTEAIAKNRKVASPQPSNDKARVHLAAESDDDEVPVEIDTDDDDEIFPMILT